MISYNDIIRRLVKYRTQTHRTQLDFANLLSLSQGQVSKLEHGEYILSYDILFTLHTQTDLDIDFLVTGRKTPHTVFHKMEEKLVSSAWSRYDYTTLILYAITAALERFPAVKGERLRQTGHVARLLYYTAMSGDHRMEDCWINLRKAFDFTQLKFAGLMNIDLKRYRSIERGYSPANVELLMNLYNELKVKPSYFMNGQVENYEDLNLVLRSFSQEQQKRILQFIESGIGFINEMEAEK